MRLRALSTAALVVVSAAACSRTPAPPSSPSFPTPEAAVQALLSAVKSGDVEKVIAIFGPEGRELAASADPAQARRHREVFIVAMAERWRLADGGSGTKTLVIGNEDWPFPIPLARGDGGWRFDTAAGKEEVLARRIGHNELATIRVCRTYVVAQRIYAARGHDGQPAGAFAQLVRSDTGRENGLYWPARREARRSPLGELLAEAAYDARAAADAGRPAPPFHGYYFRILTAQGADAPGGAKSYVADGRMSGGFALVAWPAQYDATGVMTFIVNQDGSVYEKDLGADTANAVKAITAYNPDTSWTSVATER